MKGDKFSELKRRTQDIIDLITINQMVEASNRWAEVSELLDEILDHSQDDEDLFEISRYQVLLNQLHQKINQTDNLT